MQTQAVFTLLTSVINSLKAPAACALIAIGLTACGGGSAGIGTDNRLNDKAPDTSAPQKDEDSTSQTDDEQEPDTSNQDDTGDGETGSDEETNSSGDDTDDVNPGSDDMPVSEDSGDSSSGDSQDEDSTAENDTDSTPSDENLVDVSGLVRLEWDAPQSRENGEYLEIYEIGGYELRYREKGSSEYEVIPVSDGATEYHEFDGLDGSYEFAIAAYDTNGLYSEFVNLSPVSTN